LLLLLQLMLKTPIISTYAGWQTSTPLIHCHTDDVVIHVAPVLYQSLRQVVDVTHSWAVYTLLQLAPDLMVNWIEPCNLSLDARVFSTFDLPRWLPFCFCLCKNYVNADVNIGRAQMSNKRVLEMAIFDHFLKQYLSNGQAGCCDISQKHCQQMAFHDTKKNNGYHSLF